MTAIFRAAYRLCLALWIGGIAMFTFIVTPRLFGALGRNEAGRIVDFLFPSYFGYNLILALVATAAFLACARGPWSPSRKASLLLILLSIGLTGYVRFSLFPRAVAVKRTVSSFDTVPPEDPARREFRRLHGRSMVLNLALFADVTLLFLLAPAGPPKGSARSPTRGSR